MLFTKAIYKREPHNTSCPSYEYKKPNACPHCGVVINATATVQACSNNIYIIFFRCTCEGCKKLFFGVYKCEESTKEFNFLWSYPEPYQKELSLLIRELSPRCVELYNQSIAAENLNHYDLAACGYRNSIEVLLKDYAIKYKDVKPDNLKRKSLSECIKSYLDGLDETVASYIIKDFANNLTHYPPDEEIITFEEFKVCFDLLMGQIENMLRLRSYEKHLPEKLQRKFGLPAQQDGQPDDTNQ